MKSLDVVTPVRGGKFSDAARVQVRSYIEAHEGRYVRLRLGPPDATASDPQRRYWFGVIVEHVADHSGYTKDEAHHMLLWHLMPELRKTVKDFEGRDVARRVSWNELMGEEATTLIDRAFKFAAEKLGLYIPSPREYYEQIGVDKKTN